MVSKSKADSMRCRTAARGKYNSSIPQRTTTCAALSPSRSAHVHGATHDGRDQRVHGRYGVAQMSASHH
eukprot:CAMPEP_0196668036 /NCGR_PEP_ID=MMETSP1086-20130531/65408_1 /TAXON_ID=77921 /ORGANISM="Cyanoptyche  gloeocystis , Strain SAG4.97" /LENGTH=68 /DNA_ID=CAMNT_0042005419 /DNA_START=1041 /DNA_END=1247 /DNA_ORIENTATION=-